MDEQQEQHLPPPAVPDAAPPVRHEVSLVDHHRFIQSVCSCGWVGSGRRARHLAREEARDHALLYAGAQVSENPGAAPGEAAPRPDVAADGVTAG